MDVVQEELLRKLTEKGEGVGLRLTEESSKERNLFGKSSLPKLYVEGTVVELGSNWVVMRTPGGYFHVLFLEVENVWCVAMPPEKYWGQHPKRHYELCECRNRD